MKKLSIIWLVLRHGVEKYLVKNFKIFVPNSSGNSKLLGFHTSQSINLIFPLISKLISTFKIKIKITNVSLFCKKKEKKKKIQLKLKNYLIIMEVINLQFIIII